MKTFFKLSFDGSFILCNLSDERINGCKSQLIPYSLIECDHDLTVIKIARKIEKMNLETSVAAVECRIVSYVGNTAVK